MDGMKVMEEIARDERLKHLVIVVVTSSKAERTCRARTSCAATRTS
jgi:CheY-like chemotaxis protein